jgi:hypothetical protein
MTTTMPSSKIEHKKIFILKPEIPLYMKINEKKNK